MFAGGGKVGGGGWFNQTELKCFIASQRKASGRTDCLITLGSEGDFKGN